MPVWQAAQNQIDCRALNRWFPAVHPRLPSPRPRPRTRTCHWSAGGRDQPHRPTRIPKPSAHPAKMVCESWWQLWPHDNRGQGGHCCHTQSAKTPQCSKYREGEYQSRMGAWGPELFDNEPVARGSMRGNNATVGRKNSFGLIHNSEN